MRAIVFPKATPPNHLRGFAAIIPSSAKDDPFEGLVQWFEAPMTLMQVMDGALMGIVFHGLKERYKKEVWPSTDGEVVLFQMEFIGDDGATMNVVDIDSQQAIAGANAWIESYTLQ